MVQNVYVHIPFCKQKCKYCSFISFPKIEQKDNYIISLKKEILANYKNENLKTLYFGGGTPSLLSVSDFREIIKLFKIDEETEITVELNPETVDHNYLFELRKVGVNRLSIGCQTFNDKILEFIGRRHDAQKVIEVLKFAREAGFDNVSLDFIYGLPNQTIENFENDLSIAVKENVKHISLYGLKIEEGCYFYKNYPQNLPDDDMQAEMYGHAVKLLTDNGFEHYEISNFAKSGYESNHNLNYWKNNSYYGFGVASHGYVNGIRYSNPKSLELYMENPILHDNEKLLSEQEKLEEEIFLGFRCMKGIDIKYIDSKYNIDFENKYSRILKKYISTGHVKKAGNRYMLTLDGILVSNYILADFIE